LTNPRDFCNIALLNHVAQTKGITLMKANTFSPWLLNLVAAFCLLAAPQAQARFITPTDNVPFRRDLLPIDVETMKQLCGQLTVISAAVDSKNHEQQRTAAQLLALAQALDPVNRQTMDLLDQLSEENTPSIPELAVVAAAKSRAWRTQSWLASDEAGKDGNTLALCLGEVLANVDPDHPSAAGYKKETGPWKNWVASLDEFKPKIEPQITQREESPEETPPEENPKEETSDNKEVVFARNSAVITSPLWLYREETKDYILKLTPISMSTYTDTEHENFRYHLKDFDEERIRPILIEINNSTVPRFREKYHGLPRGGVVHLSFPPKDIYSIRRNGEALSAAAAVLAASSISGDEPTGIVIGIVEEDGKLSLPKNSWELIRSLAACPPTRIVLPKSAEEMLNGLLAMDDLGFFMKHDIFLAANLDELIAFSKKQPDAAVAASLSNFASIREKSTSSIGPFVTNQFVRGRLETIATATPQYASAQFLLLQAKGKRPTELSEKCLAHQIRAALLPLNQITDFYRDDEGHRVTSALVQAAHESARTNLDPLDRIVAADDRALYNEALNLANTARTLARAMKKVSDKGYGVESFGFHDKSFGESIRALRDGLPLMEREIARILGEPVRD
jgi:hypothetical protein